MNAFLTRPWLVPLLLLAAVALFFGASTLLTTCDTKQTGELSRSAERRVKARRDSAQARAVRFGQLAQASAAHAAAAYDSTKHYNDTLTYLRQHETDVIHIAPADTARIQRLWSDVFGH